MRVLSWTTAYPLGCISQAPGWGRSSGPHCQWLWLVLWPSGRGRSGTGAAHACNMWEIYASLSGWLVESVRASLWLHCMDEALPGYAAACPPIRSCHRMRRQAGLERNLYSYVGHCAARVYPCCPCRRHADWGSPAWDLGDGSGRTVSHRGKGTRRRRIKF